MTSSRMSTSSTDHGGDAHADLAYNWDDKEMKSRWEAFSRFGNATATEISGKNLDKWLKDGGVLDGKHISTTMTGIAFSKVAG